jgi:hypothetical protein
MRTLEKIVRQSPVPPTCSYEKWRAMSESERKEL